MTTTSDGPAHLIHCNSAHGLQLERDRVRELLAGGTFFWLDVHAPAADDLEILRDEFGFHPLALEDSWRFGQRPKVEEYDGYVFLVVFGAADDGDADGLVEMHCFYSDRYLVTLHRDASPATDELRERYAMRQTPVVRPGRLLHAVVDGLVDGFFPRLGAIDEQIDDLENDLFAKASEEQLQDIFRMKRELVAMRKVVAPQRDLFASVSAGVETLPGMSDDDRRYFRDVYDHLIRLGDMIDTYRDLLTGAMDVYLSTVSNRLNSVMKQLAVIATVFMPLTFLTGFFGQNFAWMVGHIAGWERFVVLGIGLELVVIATILALFWRRGWLSR